MKFQFLQKHKTTEEKLENNEQEVFNMKNAFLPVRNGLLEKAEEKMGFPFPNELKEFYKSIGYGYMHQQDDEKINNFMGPMRVALIYKKEDDLSEYIEQQGTYDDPDRLIFFEYMDATYLTISLSESTSEKSPVYYFEDKIFDSIEDFLEAYDSNRNLFDELGSND